MGVGGEGDFSQAEATETLASINNSIQITPSSTAPLSYLSYFTVGLFLRFAFLQRYTWYLTSTETTRLIIRDGEKGGGGGMEVGERELYTCRYTVTTRMTSAINWVPF